MVSNKTYIYISLYFLIIRLNLIASLPDFPASQELFFLPWQIDIILKVRVSNGVSFDMSPLKVQKKLAKKENFDY